MKFVTKPPLTFTHSSACPGSAKAMRFGARREVTTAESTTNLRVQVPSALGNGMDRTVLVITVILSFRNSSRVPWLIVFHRSFYGVPGPGRLSPLNYRRKNPRRLRRIFRDSKEVELPNKTRASEGGYSVS